MDIEELRAKRKELRDKTYSDLLAVEGVAKESDRAANIAGNSQNVLDGIDAEFERITALDNTDITFMLFAAMLQSLRWVLTPELKLPQIKELSPQIPKEERLRANEKDHIGGVYDGKSSGAEYELSELSKYREKYPEQAEKSQAEFYKKNNKYRGWMEILTQPVPYDAMNGLDKSSIPNIANLNMQSKNGYFNNIYAKNHHVATLGHDPILGWLFGTANILTSTITFVDFQSYEVHRGHKIKSLGQFVDNRELQFSDQAIDFLAQRGLFDIFSECVMSAKEDNKRVAAAVVRQAIHFASDKYCIDGLPIPILSTIDPQKAQDYIEKGWNSVEFEKIVKGDLKTIGISAAVGALINLIIECIYLLCIKTEDVIDIRRVRIKKILSIAGVISSSSNLLYVALTENIAKLDIAGMGMTMLSLLRSEDFICKVKQEYIKNNFSNLIMDGRA